MPSSSGRVRPGAVERWSSVEEVCDHLGIVRDTVYRWIDGRGMPAHRVGRIWKFKLSEVDGWVRASGADDSRQRANKRPRAAPKDSSSKQP